LPLDSSIVRHDLHDVRTAEETATGDRTLNDRPGAFFHQPELRHDIAELPPAEDSSRMADGGSGTGTGTA
jgi:hypothetical protein